MWPDRVTEQAQADVGEMTAAIESVDFNSFDGACLEDIKRIVSSDYDSAHVCQQVPIAAPPKDQRVI